MYQTLTKRREELLTEMRTVSNVLLELSEAYHELNAKTCCKSRHLCALDHLIQETLAAYDNRNAKSDHISWEWAELLSESARRTNNRPVRPTLPDPPPIKPADIYGR